MKLDLITSHLYYLVFLPLSIFVGSSNVYLELKRGVPRIHLISIHYVFITPLYVCVFVMFFFVPVVIFLSIFIAISISLNLNWREVQLWCSRSRFPFCWWTMEIQYRLLAHILNLLNVSIDNIKIIVGTYLNVLHVLNIWMNEYWTY